MKRTTSQRRATALQVGEVFENQRRKLGLTQAELSKAMSVSQGYISKVEAGQVVPSVLEWIKFCSITGTKIDALAAPATAKRIAARPAARRI